MQCNIQVTNSTKSTNALNFQFKVGHNLKTMRREALMCHNQQDDQTCLQSVGVQMPKRLPDVDYGVGKEVE